MRAHHVAVVIVLLVASSASAALATRATDISGTWSFAVDVGGTRGDPTFVFSQQGETLTGTVTRARVEQRITGSVKGNKARFGFQGTRDGRSFKATYDGTIESPTRMTGVVEFSGSLSGTGQWVAVKK